MDDKFNIVMKLSADLKIAEQTVQRMSLERTTLLRNFQGCQRMGAALHLTLKNLVVAIDTDPMMPTSQAYQTSVKLLEALDKMIPPAPKVVAP